MRMHGSIEEPKITIEGGGMVVKNQEQADSRNWIEL